jgi:hypothetical protein
MLEEVDGACAAIVVIKYLLVGTSVADDEICQVAQPRLDDWV